MKYTVLLALVEVLYAAHHRAMLERTSVFCKGRLHCLLDGREDAQSIITLHWRAGEAKQTPADRQQQV